MRIHFVHRAWSKHQGADALYRPETNGDDQTVLDDDLPSIFLHNEESELYESTYILDGQIILPWTLPNIGSTRLRSCPSLRQKAMCQPSRRSSRPRACLFSACEVRILLAHLERSSTTIKTALVYGNLKLMIRCRCSYHRHLKSDSCI